MTNIVVRVLWSISVVFGFSPRIYRAVRDGFPRHMQSGRFSSLTRNITVFTLPGGVLDDRFDTRVRFKPDKVRRILGPTRQKGDRVYTPVSLPDTLRKRLCTLGKLKLASDR